MTPRTPEADRGRGVRVGFAGAGAALLALVLCATPGLALVLAALGAGAATGAIGAWLDGVAIAVLVGSLAVLGRVWLGRRRARAIPVDRAAPAAGGRGGSASQR